VSASIAWRMFAADFLKLRKKRSTVIWALVLVLAPVVIYFIVKVIQHSSNPSIHEPAGGISAYRDTTRVLALFFGPLAAIMIGTDGGAGDLSAGVFRDLVVTGRSRVALFFSRVPASLSVCWVVMFTGYVIAMIGSFAFAGGLPTPDASLVVDGLLFTLLSTGTVCVVAVGFAALVGSRPAALTVLIGWQLIASRILESIDSLGGSRRLILTQAIDHFSPFSLSDSHGPGAVVTMSTGTAILVIAGWLAVFCALGAWRTKTMDA